MAGFGDFLIDGIYAATTAKNYYSSVQCGNIYIYIAIN